MQLKIVPLHQNARLTLTKELIFENPMTLKFIGAKGAQQIAGQMNKEPHALIIENILLSKCFLVFLNFKTCFGEDKEHLRNCTARE